ncbi:ricin-type beta-trefoil lectin domain protein [Streptomyces sp. NPDC020490]|uniref:ricin-type beta-trefoil lectin domain protein n=1 Tax=Streptomyces sp. NPDC020490 TaxID=3365078 RepID=UPI0037A5F744
MERATGLPESPGESAVWERPLPWLEETGTQAGAATSPAADADAVPGVRTEPGPAPEGPDPELAPLAGATPDSEGGQAPDGVSETGPESPRTPEPEPEPEPESDPEWEREGERASASHDNEAPAPSPAPDTAPALAPDTTPAPDTTLAPDTTPALTSPPAPEGPSARTPDSADGSGTAGGPPGGLFRPSATGAQAPGPRDGAGSREAEPERGARIVGATVAACVLLGLGLGAVAFLAVPGDSDSEPRAASVGDGAVPRLATDGAPGPTGSPSASAKGRRGHDEKGTGTHRAEDAHAAGSPTPKADPGHQHPAAGAPATGAAAAESGGTSTGEKSTSGNSEQTTTTAVAGDAIVGYGSSKCIEVSAHAGVDGSPLRLWGCDGHAWQKWLFKSDGSVRSMGRCLDIANASQADGAVIQLATCNGGWAQRFRLNSAHDLVNTQIGKCVDAKDGGTANGTRLQLWDCAGTSNQKWRLG